MLQMMKDIFALIMTLIGIAAMIFAPAIIISYCTYGCIEWAIMDDLIYWTIATYVIIGITLYVFITS